MPRQSQFVIGLSDTERVELEARAGKYTLPYRDGIIDQRRAVSRRGWFDRHGSAAREFVYEAPRVEPHAIGSGSRRRNSGTGRTVTGPSCWACSPPYTATAV